MGLMKLHPVGTLAFQSKQCGSNFGIQGMGTIASALTCEYCFSLEKPSL